METKKLILLKRLHPVVYEVHKNEINQTRNLILTTSDKELAEKIVDSFNKIYG